MERRPRPDRRPGHPLLFAAAALLAPVLWVIFVASFSAHEMWLGVAASVATLIFTYFVSRSARIRLDLRFTDFAQCWRVPQSIVSDSFAITLLLLKDLFGIARADNLYRVSSFDADGRDPRTNARSVMAIIFTTASPNFLVIGIDTKQSRMLFHQVKREPVTTMTRALGAGR